MVVLLSTHIATAAWMMLETPSQSGPWPPTKAEGQVRDYFEVYAVGQSHLYCTLSRGDDGAPVIRWTASGPVLASGESGGDWSTAASATNKQSRLSKSKLTRGYMRRILKTRVLGVSIHCFRAG